MSFRVYLNTIVDPIETEIFSNTESIGTFETSTTSLLNIIGISSLLTEKPRVGTLPSWLTYSDSSNRYVTINHPIFSVAGQSTNEFRVQDTFKATRANIVSFSSKFHTLANSDYMVLFISDLDGVVEPGLLQQIENKTGSTLLRDKTTGAWGILLARGPSGYTKLVEDYDESGDVVLYYLVQSELNTMDLSKWNTLFTEDDDAEITTYYQTIIDTIDALLYADDSNYLQILARIHHQLTHEPDGRDNNFDGDVTDTLEQPYYDTYPDNLATDMVTLQTDVRSAIKTANSAGLLDLRKNQKHIIHNAGSRITFLSIDMINDMLHFRNYYLELRDEISDKLNITLSE